MVSIFKEARATKGTPPERNLSLDAFFDGVKQGQWQDEILAYRTGKLEKVKLHAVTASGIFKERNAKGLVQHSGVICMDVDEKDQLTNVDVSLFKDDQFVHAFHKSASGGSGYAVYFKIDPDRHLDAFLGLEEYLFVNYSIVVDKSCKDVSRLRFVSYDPDLFLNDKSKVFKKYLKKKEIQKKQFTPIVIKSDFDEMVNKAGSMNLFDSYDEYISLAFGLSSHFRESGEHYFHTLCQGSQKYDYKKASDDYLKCCKRKEAGISISSVYWRFKEAGISLTSEKTERIKTIIKISDNPEEDLKDLGIEDDENLTEKLKTNAKEQTELDEIVELIKLQKIKFNEITRNFELKGTELNDRTLSEFYANVWEKIDDKISKDKIWTLIQSKKNTPSFNPIHDFFLKNENVIPDNEFEKIKSCFKIKAEYCQENGEIALIDDYLDVYLKKWLLGIVGSAFGTYSLMILVLVGEQGIKKTEFFRNLLPKDLQKYYAESNLDEGKDSEILMCKKLIIMDDEFGGKSKKDATKLKRLSSQQTFSIRAPYGRITEDLNRLAVLCGTSNDNEVINDPTGNRRIIPVNLISFDLEKFKSIDKTKLFIELYNEWKNDKDGWFLTKHEIYGLNESTIGNTDIWQEEEILSKYLTDEVISYMTTTEIKLAMEMRFPTLKTNTKRVGQTLKKLGYVQEMKKIDGKNMRAYRLFFQLM